MMRVETVISNTMSTPFGLAGFSEVLWLYQQTGRFP